MQWNFLFFLNAIGLGIGLAMDAFSVSVANGLQERQMKFGRMALIAGAFGVFQTLMPLLGWVCVHTIVEIFRAADKFVPWIALALLLFLGGKMVYEGLHNREEEMQLRALTFSALLVQGIATSIDALSVGFTIADFPFVQALVETLIIGIVTFVICIAGLLIGKAVGNKFSSKATIVGGVILILIGLEIFISGVFGL